jgi:hypothetical protein
MGDGHGALYLSSKHRNFIACRKHEWCGRYEYYTKSEGIEQKLYLRPILERSYIVAAYKRYAVVSRKIDLFKRTNKIPLIMNCGVDDFFN